MGSFNDLTLGQSMQDGKIVWKENEIELNEALTRLRSEAWELATYIKRIQEKDAQGEAPNRGSLS